MKENLSQEEIKMSRRRKQKHDPIRVLLIALIAMLILGSAWMVKLCFDLVSQPYVPSVSAPAEDAADSGSSLFGKDEETQSEETEPTAPTVVSTATLSAQGDLLMHLGVLNSAKDEEGNYDFSYIFRFLKEYLAESDYSVANLETTFGGPANPYRGNPEFNCPDAFAANLKDAGYDLLLTANNHASDTRTPGIKRTLETARAAGLTTLGTMLTNEEKKYEIVDINGIRIGMLCYTYADNVTGDGRPSLNFKDYVEDVGIVNFFMENNLPKFYTEVETHLASMEAEGVDATIVFLHWGKEYEKTENGTQNAIAQKLCDLGVDVILGGHPHVLQPVELLSSTADPAHKTVCVYSLGNAVSNQMKNEDEAFASGHSEDGAMVSVTFEKLSDGTVRLAGMELLPTWVNRNENTGKRQYDIIPLEKAREGEWGALYGLTGEQYTAAQESYNRTMAIMGAGMEEVNTYLAGTKTEQDTNS